MDATESQGSRLHRFAARAWDRRAARRLAYLNELRRTEMAAVLDRHAQRFSGRDVLEIGSGTGAQLDQIGLVAASVIGVDIEESNYHAVRDARILVYDGHVLPFEDDSFDLVFSSNVLEHIAHRVPFQAEIARVLRPGGHCIHVLPTHRWRLLTMATQAALVPYNMTLQVALSLRDRQWRLPASLKAFGELVLGQRHGEFGNFASEPLHMRPSVWRRVFQATGWTVEEQTVVPILYSGNALLGPVLGFRVRRALAGVLGASMALFVLSRCGSPAGSTPAR
jgi:2-polyprenyl-3-methyl-5-hydroxy-6-metoxy-1,4-benzoquinol methylase